MSLPDLDEPNPPVACVNCGEYMVISGFCGVCEDREREERLERARVERIAGAQFRSDMEEVRARARAHFNAGREYRNAQFRADMQGVQARVRAHLRGE